ncbi:MAG: universal stress protein, partial [Trueperaceae bacterium]|nr:universal stress protein [Trueperaceae bacterium]
TVLVGLDGSRRAECVLPVVRFLATAVASKVVLAHVIEEPALPRLVPPTPEETALVEHLMAVNESAAGDYLADVEARIGVSTETRLKRGKSTVSALHAMVDESGADLVILSAHGYGGDQTWPYGEVATNLIGYGRTPLLVVHDVPWTERTAPAADVTDEAWGR